MWLSGCVNKSKTLIKMIDNGHQSAVSISHKAIDICCQVFCWPVLKSLELINSIIFAIQFFNRCCSLVSWHFVFSWTLNLVFLTWTFPWFSLCKQIVALFECLSFVSGWGVLAQGSNMLHFLPWKCFEPNLLIVLVIAKNSQDPNFCCLSWKRTFILKLSCVCSLLSPNFNVSSKMSTKIQMMLEHWSCMKPLLFCRANQNVFVIFCCGDDHMLWTIKSKPKKVGFVFEVRRTEKICTNSTLRVTACFVWICQCLC